MTQIVNRKEIDHMGFFSKKKKDAPDPKERAAKEENRRKLDEFNVTKAWGIKKYEGAGAYQFIFDEEKRWFVVVPGPVSDFRDKEPWVVDFDQASDVILDVDEYWTKEGGQYAPGRDHGILLMDDYSKVYWRYDFYLTIGTHHPYAGKIRYKMNFKTTVTKVESRNLMYRRGFEIGGSYRGKQIKELRGKMDELIETEQKAVKRGHVLDMLDSDHPDNAADAVKQGVRGAVGESRYMKKIENMRNHVKRAERIAALLFGEKD